MVYQLKEKKPEETTRVCKDCGVEQPIENFPTSGPLKWRRTQCRPCYNEAAKKRANEAYKKDPEELKRRQREYREKRKTDGAPVFKTEEDYKQHRHDIYLARRERLRAETFAAYGGAVCACCGETIERFLTLDHIYGGGNDERREAKCDGLTFYNWLKKQGYPPGYQVLCFNCNCGRHHNGGICPHKMHEHG
jgi:hypothetical protein